jgi:hypothetical protein
VTDKGHWLRLTVAKKNAAYSAPALTVSGAAFERGVPFIAQESAGHSLDEFNYNRGAWSGTELLGAGHVYSAPSIVINTKDEIRPVTIAYQGGGRSAGIIFFNNVTADWQNDPLGGSGVDSAVAIAAQAAGPARQLDLIFQGTGNSRRGRSAATGDHPGWSAPLRAAGPSPAGPGRVVTRALRLGNISYVTDE